MQIKKTIALYKNYVLPKIVVSDTKLHKAFAQNVF